MRTDTRTFRDRVLRQVRALGINSNRSKRVAARIVDRVRHGSYMDAEEKGRDSLVSIELKLCIRSEDRQFVDVHLDGAYAFPATCDDWRLVSTEATPRQLELAAEMRSLSDHIRDLRQGVWMSQLDADGAPDWDAPSVCVQPALPQEHPEIQALLARHDAAQAESLRINRFADVRVLDPELADIHYECCKDEGWRPAGYHSLDEVRAFLDHRRENAANDDASVADAA